MAFEAALYETVPQTNVPGTLAVVRGVITAGKEVPHPSAKKALRRVRATGENLRELYQAAPPAKSESLTKAADAAMDEIWSAVGVRVATYSAVGGADGAEAARVHGVLFPNGMAFLNFKYAEQWAESEAILGRIASEKLEGALDKFVGAPFLEVLRKRHAAYGEALGITKPKAPEPDAASLVEPLRQARAALSTYARVIVAAVANDELDEKVATVALAPIAALRSSLRSNKRKGGEAEPVPPEPLPPVDG
jgi:hypothetical protein